MSELINRYRTSINPPYNWKDYLNLTLTFLLLIALPVGIYLSQHQQDIRNRAAPTTTATTYSVVMNQQSPRFGDSVSFTAVYPKEATRSITTVQHENPDVLMNCYQSNVQVYSRVFVFPSETNNKDGTLTGISNLGILSSNSGNGISWSGGAATCYATLYYFGRDRLIHVLAEQRDIYVAP